MFSRKLIKELQDIFKKDYGVTYTDDEAQEVATNLKGYFEILLKYQHQKNQSNPKVYK